MLPYIDGRVSKADYPRCFIKDRVEIGDVEINYCPTYDMVSDFFTKPLPG